MQVLDASTDEVTQHLVDAAAARQRALGYNVTVERRGTREGYKAGNLAHVRVAH